MTEPTKTPWFNASEHDPVRPGIYLAKRPGDVLWWRAFDGKDWYSGIRAAVDLTSENSETTTPAPSYEYLMGRIHSQFYKIPTRYFEWCGVTKDLQKSDK